LILILLLLIIGAISIGAAGYLSTQKPYTVYDDHIPVAVSGHFQTVADVVDAAAISLRPEDLIMPDLQEPADPEAAIQIQRARPVTISSQKGSRTVWTQQRSLAAFLVEAGITIQPNEQLLIDQLPVAPELMTQQKVPPAINIVPREIEVSIEEGDRRQGQKTTAQTVAEVLQEAGIQLEEADRVNPAPGTQLVAGMIIQITRAIPLTIQVDGQVIQIRSLNNKPLEVLAEAGVELSKADYTLPVSGTILQSGDIVQVIRVTDEYRFEDEEIPFQTVYQPSDELDLDSKAVLSNGVPGIKRRRIRLIFEDGVQLGEELEEEWIEIEPINQVIGYGTRINTGTIDTPLGPREYWRVVRMRATAYTAASSGKSPDHPAYGITASGVPAGTGVVAADLNVIPFQSEVFVPGYGIGIVGDTGGGVKGRWIDLGYDEDELVTWNGYADVYYLTPIPEKINYLLPEVLP
jgi:uncharacterized protein YabE (DUF348 family)/3D (Asp-Asp-Asp) domain-containing protein